MRAKANTAFEARGYHPTRTLMAADLKRIGRDPMTVFLLFLPFVIGLAARWGLPLLAETLQDVAEFDLRPFFPLINTLLLLMAPMMVGWTAAFALLEEKDQDMLPTLQVTPLPPWSLTIGRVLWTWPAAFLAILVVAALSGLAPPFQPRYIPAALVMGLQAPFTATLIARLARNRVQGLTIAKAYSFILAAPCLEELIDSPWRFAAGVLPTYWAGGLFLHINSMVQFRLFLIPALLLPIGLLVLLGPPKGRGRVRPPPPQPAGGSNS